MTPVSERPPTSLVPSQNCCFLPGSWSGIQRRCGTKWVINNTELWDAEGKRCCIRFIWEKPCLPKLSGVEHTAYLSNRLVVWASGKRQQIITRKLRHAAWFQAVWRSSFVSLTTFLWMPINETEQVASYWLCWCSNLTNEHLLLNRWHSSGWNEQVCLSHICAVWRIQLGTSKN